MEQRLEVAAREGNIDALYSLLKEDAYLLERIEGVPFIDTPLHIAASAGQVRFAMEIMRLKPSFARKLNQNGHSPIHHALQNKQTNLVLCLLDIDRDLVRVQGREGKTALHFAAECGMVDLLAVFLSVCPESIRDLTIRKETALHVAVKSDKLEALKVLLEWLEHVGKNGVLQWSDDEGNTILHVAASRNQVEVVNSLIACGVDVQAINMADVTALDISNQSNEMGNPDITDILGKQESRDTIINARALEAASDAKWPFKYLRRNERLRDVRHAAQFGDTEILLSLIQKDPCILECFDDLPFVETPLHIAARLGHFNFAREIMRWKPSFAKKPNQEGLYPIHLATQNGHIQILKQLLSFDKGLVRLQGREGKTSLHYAAEKGNIDLLDALLTACPPSMEDVTDRSDTALHIAIKHSKSDAFNFLLKRLQRAAIEQETKVLSFPDDEGNTVLHTAKKRNQPEVVKQLLDVQALVKLAQSLDITKEDRPSRHRCLAILYRYLQILSTERLIMSVIRYNRGISVESRHMLLAVCALIATMTYQTAVDPPKSTYRDSVINNDRKNISCIFNNTITNSSSPNGIIFCSMQNSNTTTASGDQLLGEFSARIILFWMSNILALTLSVMTIFFVLPNKLRSVMFAPLAYFVICYVVTTGITGSWFWLILTVVILLGMFSIVAKIIKRLQQGDQID